jgi:hypothetical protein
VAGGEEHDLPLNEPANQALLQQLEEAAAAGGVNDIVLQVRAAQREERPSCHPAAVRCWRLVWSRGSRG